MARRKGPTNRDELKAKLLDAAESLLASGGTKNLTARNLARAIGYSLGHVYNLVADMDELVLALNARTLARLHAALEETASVTKGPDQLYAFAETYLTFTAQHADLWHLVLSHRLAEGGTLPADYSARISALPALVSKTLQQLGPTRHADEIARDVAILWAGLHGLSSLDSAGRLALIGPHTAKTLAQQLITRYLAGLTDGAKTP